MWENLLFINMINLAIDTVGFFVAMTSRLKAHANIQSLFKLCLLVWMLLRSAQSSHLVSISVQRLKGAEHSIIYTGKLEVPTYEKVAEANIVTVSDSHNAAPT